MNENAARAKDRVDGRTSWRTSSRLQKRSAILLDGRRAKPREMGLKPRRHGTL